MGLPPSPSAQTGDGGHGIQNCKDTCRHKCATISRLCGRNLANVSPHLGQSLDETDPVAGVPCRTMLPLELREFPVASRRRLPIKFWQGQCFICDTSLASAAFGGGGHRCSFSFWHFCPHCQAHQPNSPDCTAMAAECAFSSIVANTCSTNFYRFCRHWQKIGAVSSPCDSDILVSLELHSTDFCVYFLHPFRSASALKSSI